ncbi:hypothetical protein PT974_04152 [Cladobotryum mycophilum]|uniref:Uncharacterized protein n=1 Tax=Cladobotryum mycophilum TaxID=491253 RepID=A0ABR0SUP1_9HYPO
MADIAHLILGREEGSAECEFVGEGMADIAGIGIIVGFVGQALISLSLACWVFLLSKHGNLDVLHDEGTVEYAIARKRLECVLDILMVGNDIQMLLGSSYMITVFASGDTIDLYHLHLVFDITLQCRRPHLLDLLQRQTIPIQNQHVPQTQTTLPLRPLDPRHRGVYIFAVMYLALLIFVCQRLNEWSPDHEPGRCYHAHLVTHPGATHPFADRIYIIITGIWTLLTTLAAAFFGARWRHSVLILATLQFPVHLYMALALRTANQGKLAGEEEHENGWDFGQTTAVLLLAMAVRELLSKGWEFYAFERDVRKDGLKKTPSGATQLIPARELNDLEYRGSGGVYYDEGYNHVEGGAPYVKPAVQGPK